MLVSETNQAPVVTNLLSTQINTVGVAELTTGRFKWLVLTVDLAIFKKKSAHRKICLLF